MRQYGQWNSDWGHTFSLSYGAVKAEHKVTSSIIMEPFKVLKPRMLTRSLFHCVTIFIWPSWKDEGLWWLILDQRYNENLTKYVWQTWKNKAMAMVTGYVAASHIYSLSSKAWSSDDSVAIASVTAGKSSSLRSSKRRSPWTVSMSQSFSISLYTRNSVE